MVAAADALDEALDKAIGSPIGSPDADDETSETKIADSENA